MRRAAFLLAVVIFTRCGRPPLRVVQQGALITIDAQTLGEYPSDVARLRLSDVSNKRVVWEIRGRNDPQIGKVTFAIGVNRVDVQDVRHGSYDVIKPSRAQTFTIDHGARYSVEAWGRDNEPMTRAIVEFTTPRS